MRSDRMIASQMGVFADLSPERRLDAIKEHLKEDPDRVQLAGLFGSTAAGSRLTWKACHPSLRPIKRHRALWSTG
jgi:hypothetical protein